MVSCPQCTFENPSNEAECSLCSAPLPRPKKTKKFVNCPQCTLENPSTAKNCKICDAALPQPPVGSSTSDLEGSSALGGGKKRESDASRGTDKKQKVDLKGPADMEVDPSPSSSSGSGSKSKSNSNSNSSSSSSSIGSGSKSKSNSSSSSSSSSSSGSGLGALGALGKGKDEKEKTPVSLLFEQLKCPEWRKELRGEFGKPYVSKLEGFLREQELAGKKIFPPLGFVFDALNRCPLSKVRVVMLGQDPYHGPNQAHGLCFSVQKGVPVPPSLRNMYKELTNDIEGFKTPRHGNLNKWANQGVLLLNTTLTVEKAKPKSHAGKGWETLTEKIISIVNQKCKDVVFLLWGAHAQTKGKTVSKSKHHVLTCAHPSPLSAHNGFYGCKHFSKTNQILKRKSLEPIDWLID